MTNEQALKLLRTKMTTREEAIAALIEGGLNARARDWSMGQTIHIMSSVGQTTDNGITCSPIGGYLYPEGDQWCLMDGTLFAPVARFDALVLAVRGAVIWFTGLEAIHLAQSRKSVL
jgi:hypothetical protein